MNRDAALTRLIEEVGPTRVLDEARGDRRLLRRLIGGHPELLLDPEAMRSEAGREFLEMARAGGDVDLDRLLDGLRFVDDADFVDVIFALDGRRAVDRVLVAVEVGVSLPARWLDRAFVHEGALVEAFVRRHDVKLSTFLLIMGRLGVRNEAVRAVGPETWASVIARSRKDLAEADHVGAAAYAFAMAMDRPGTGAEDLLAFSFDPLHAAAARERIGAAWCTVEPFLPGGWSLWAWDKCRRLRAGVTEAYLRHGLDPARLISTTRSLKNFKSLLQESHHRYGGTALLEGALGATDAQGGARSRMRKAIEKLLRTDR